MKNEQEMLFFSAQEIRNQKGKDELKTAAD